MADFQDYTATKRFESVADLLPNHFRFVLTDLPDLTFFAQQVILPDINSEAPKRANPFTTIPEVGDHLAFSPLTVHYTVDVGFKSYYSLFYWMRGYGFPKSYDDIANFQASRRRQLANPRPIAREITKTHGQLILLAPDTDKPVVTIDFEDVFPLQLGQLSFDTTISGTPEPLTTQVTFAYTDYEITLN